MYLEMGMIDMLSIREDLGTLLADHWTSVHASVPEIVEDIRKSSGKTVPEEDDLLRTLTDAEVVKLAKDLLSPF